MNNMAVHTPSLFASRLSGGTVSWKFRARSSVVHPCGAEDARLLEAPTEKKCARSVCLIARLI
jgi:hypothetical protein